MVSIVPVIVMIGLFIWLGLRSSTFDRSLHVRLLVGITIVIALTYVRVFSF